MTVICQNRQNLVIIQQLFLLCVIKISELYQIDQKPIMEPLFVDKKQLICLQKYLLSFCDQLGVSKETLGQQLEQKKNMDRMCSFVNDEAIYLMFLHKFDKEEIKLANKWSVETIALTNILFVKKKNFAVDIGSLQLKEVMQVIRLDFPYESFPIKFAFRSINNLINPLLENKFNEIQLKEVISMAQQKFKQIIQKIAICKETVKAPTLEIKARPFIYQILANKQEENYLKKAKKISDEQTISIIEDIQRCCLNIEEILSYEPSLKSLTSLHEKYFWGIYLESLRQIEDQFNSEKIRFCIDLLRKNNKFHITAIYDSTTVSLKAKVGRAAQFTYILGQANIQELLTSQSFFELRKSQGQVLQQLIYLRRVQKPYQILRLYKLVECLSNEITQQMVQILNKQGLMKQQTKIVDSICNRVEEITRQFQIGVANFITRQTYGNYRHRELQQRLKQIKHIKILQDTLRNLIKKEINDDQENKSSMKDLIDAAYTNFESINPFDTLNIKNQVFKDACTKFYERLDTVEYYIAKDLAFKIQKSTKTTQILETIQKFQPLSSRPRIKEALQVMKATILEIIQKGTKQLQAKFKTKYQFSQNAKISMARQMPAKVCEFLWRKQIHSKLAQCKQLIHILFTEDSQEGYNYKTNIEILLRKVDPTSISKQSQKKAFDLIRLDKVSKRSIFKVIQQKEKNIVVINLEDSQISAIQLTSKTYYEKLTNNLVTTMWKKFEHKVYEPFLSLQASLRLYYQTVSSLDESILQLVTEDKNRVMNIISLGFTNFWTNVQEYSVDLEKAIMNLHQFVSIVQNQTKIVESVILSLDNCPVEPDILRANIYDIQEIINQLKKKGMSNLHLYVDQLSKKIEKALVVRLQNTIKEWHSEFVNFTEDQGIKNRNIREFQLMELNLQNGFILPEPPLEHIKFNLLENLHSQITIICSLEQIKLDKQKQISQHQRKQGTYHHLLFQIDPRLLQKVYKDIFITFGKAAEYLRSWVHYQFLWIEDSKIFDRLQSNISMWQQLMKKIKHDKQKVEGLSDKQSFGALLIDCKIIKQLVCQKYNYWYHTIEKYFDELIISKQKSNDLSDIEGLLVYKKEKIKEMYARCDQLKIKIKKTWDQIRQNQRYIQLQLQKAQPALLSSIGQIEKLDRRDFGTLYAFQRPPPVLYLPLKALYYFLRPTSRQQIRDTRNLASYPQIRAFLIQFDFLRRYQSIKGYDVCPFVRHFITRQLLGSQEWNLERIKMCSRPVGVMGMWLEAQLMYADILDQLQPIKKIIMLHHSHIEGFENDLTQIRKDIEELQNKCGYLEGLLENQSTKINASIQIEQNKQQIKEHHEKKQLEQKDI